MYVSWNDHTARLTASVVKEVTCEMCGTEYLYALQRSETGSGTSLYGLDEQGAQQRATDRAAANLRNSLDSAFELVPCPVCGAYQSQMVQFLKNAHLKWLQVLGVVLIACAGASLLMAIFQEKAAYAGAAVVLLVAGIASIAYRRWSADQYDPNHGDPETRKQLAIGVAVLKKDLPAPASSTPQANALRHRRARHK